MTAENEADITELDRLRDHNKQLLAELKAARAEAKTAQEALQGAQAASEGWKARYHQSAVLAPLEADLRAVCAGPWKYLRDLALESKLLEMVPDAEGIERAVWLDENGEPAKLEQGLYKFLEGACDRVPDLAQTLRAHGASGGGASPSAGRLTPPEPKPEPSPQPATFGLR